VFFIDEGRHAVSNVCIQYEKVVGKIAQQLGNWDQTSGAGGRVTTSQGPFVLEKRLIHTSAQRQTSRSPTAWMYRGDQFVPILVVEINRLSSSIGQDAQRVLQLIDSRQECNRKIYDYSLDKHMLERYGRDRDVLPGFRLRVV
jgi:hypothetical protein